MNPLPPPSTRPLATSTLRVVESPRPATIGPAPDVHRIVHDASGSSVGAYSLWWRGTPPFRGRRAGMIGHFRADSALVAGSILGQACRDLASAGCSVALGPIDGSTWSDYRVVTDAGDAPPFFLEPSHPAAHADHFRESGFTCEVRYSSSLVEGLEGFDPLAERVATEMQQAGIVLRALRTADLDADLLHLHRLAAACFRGHDLYRDLPVEDFLALYRPLRPLIVPELVVIAERDARPLGFAFAIPDVSELERTGACRTLVLKTLGVVPGRATAGLGYHLLSAIRRRAVVAGYDRLILALMRETDYVVRRRPLLGKPFRRYGLFARTLSP